MTKKAHEGPGCCGPLLCLPFRVQQGWRPMGPATPSSTATLQTPLGDGAVQDSPQSQEEVPRSLSPLSGSGSERCWPSIPYLQTSSFFSPGFTILPQFPSCHMLILELPGSETLCGLSLHVLFLHKGSFPRSDIAWDSTGLLESLGGRLTGLGTTTRPEGTVRWSHQAPRPTHGGPLPQS